VEIYLVLGYQLPVLCSGENQFLTASLAICIFFPPFAFGFRGFRSNHTRPTETEILANYRQGKSAIEGLWNISHDFGGY